MDPPSLVKISVVDLLLSPPMRRMSDDGVTQLV